jgi:hypothetical protein
LVGIAVCIPTIGRSDLLRPLVEVCLIEPQVEVIELWDNQDTLQPVWPDGVEVVRAPGLSIYQEWNSFADKWGERYNLAFLNDDIEMLPGTLTALAYWLKVLAIVSVGPRMDAARVDPPGNPRLVDGTYRQDGVCGWAFMVALDCWPVGGIDERFKVWYGDDDLVWKLRRAGCVTGRLDGVTVRHEQSTTVNSLPWVAEAQAADAALWRSLGRP